MSHEGDIASQHNDSQVLDTIEVPSNIEAQSDTTALLQEPAPSIQVLPGPIYRSPYVDPGCPKIPTWNCYRCDACGYTSTKCSAVSTHIRNLAGHDPQSVSVSWVGDNNVKLAPGFISGEILKTRLERAARKPRERKGPRTQEELLNPPGFPDGSSWSPHWDRI
ncbi:hypothetical protein BGX38DRAFT_1334072 [Terfezia claveryi]|nr:hypothetical protein BGX38DRAFT_1334072 [Terfezia claveryi]